MSATATTELTAVLGSHSMQMFFDNLDSFAETLGGVAKLHELILDLAVRGKLVEQDQNNEPASELLHRATVERAEFAKVNKLRVAKPLPTPDSTDFGFLLPANWFAT